VTITRFSVAQTEQTIALAGFFTREMRNSFSTTCYRSYAHEIIENDLYIIINGGLVSPKHHFADFSITIPIDNLDEINMVYLTDGKERQLIYKLR